MSEFIFVSVAQSQKFEIKQMMGKTVQAKHIPSERTSANEYMRQINRRHQAIDAYPNNAESRRPPPIHLSQLPAIIPDYQHILTNLTLDMNIIGANVLLARNHPLHSNNNRHIPTILQGRLFSGSYTYKYILFLSMVHKKARYLSSADAFRGKILRTTVQTRKHKKTTTLK